MVHTTAPFTGKTSMPVIHIDKEESQINLKEFVVVIVYQ